MEHVKKLTSLTALYVNETRITEAALKHLKELTTLESLHLGNTVVKSGPPQLPMHITDVELEYIKGLVNLRELYLGYEVSAERMALLHAGTSELRDHAGSMTSCERTNSPVVFGANEAFTASCQTGRLQLSICGKSLTD